MKIEIMDDGRASVATDSGFEYTLPGAVPGGTESLVMEALGLSVTAVLAFPPHDGEGDGEYTARLARELCNFGMDEVLASNAAAGILGVASSLLEHMSDSELSDLVAAVTIGEPQESVASDD